MDLFIAIFKSFFIAIPVWICYIALKIKLQMWREKK